MYTGALVDVVTIVDACIGVTATPIGGEVTFVLAIIFGDGVTYTSVVTVDGKVKIINNNESGE